MNMKQISQIDSIEALAQFWDTHDLTEFEDELQEVTEPVFERDNECRQLPHIASLVSVTE